jgi:uncharacterized repeat protein (TIGR01451 family)
MHKRSFVRAVILGLCVVPWVGCQTQQLANPTALGLTARQKSLAQTPIAKANQTNSKQTIPNATSPIATGQPSNSVRNPVGNEIALIQYTEPSADSYAVPREPLPPVYSAYGNEPMMSGAVPGPMMNGPVMNGPVGPTMMPPRSVAAHSCPSCSMVGQRYQPVFSQFENGVDCSPTTSVSCGPCNPVESFAVPRQTDPQEYLFDGGDRGPTVRLRKDDSLSGLDTEDTVIQYETADGKSDVVSGCRVAIYAPRFASVRKRTGTAQSDVAMRLRTTDQPSGPGQFIDRLPSVSVSKPEKVVNQGNVNVIESVRDRDQLVPAEMVLPMLVASEAFKPFEDFSLIRNGDMKGTDLARFAKATAAARTWTNVDELQVLIDGQETTEITSKKHAEEFRLYEFKGARIRLCKVASEQMANPGDIISFTIRFDNVGEQPLSKLVVTDSLTPRLEYVEGSEKSSVASKFQTQPNAAGSDVLRWELQDGLKPGEGGLIRFDCKVR